MSIKVTSWIWDNYTGKNTKLLMMLAIADFCDDEGVCYPGVKRLAKKTRVAKGTAQKLIRALSDEKELSIILNDGLETEHGKTNRYYVIKYRTSIDITTPDSTETAHGRKSNDPPNRGVKSDTPLENGAGGIKSDVGGIKSPTTGVSNPIPKPSVEPSVKNSKTKDTPKTSNGKSSKNKPVREVTDLHHAIADCYSGKFGTAYSLHSNGNFSMAKALTGKATDKHDGSKFYQANLDTVGDEQNPPHAPVTADEFRAWHKWRLARAKGDTTFVPSAPGSVVDSVLSYRAYMVQDTPANGATPDVPPISDDEQRRFDVLFGEGTKDES